LALPNSSISYQLSALQMIEAMAINNMSSNLCSRLRATPGSVKIRKITQRTFHMLLGTER
jgi:hypothetical protein